MFFNLFIELCYGFWFDQGFRKIGQEQWEFINEDFVKDQPNLMKNIYRWRQDFGHYVRNTHSQRAAASGVSVVVAPLTESERWNFKAQIEKLRNEKEQLLMEHQRQQEEWNQNEM